MIDLEKEKAKGHCPSGINFHCPIILHWARRQTHIQGRSDRLSRGTSTRSQKDNRFMHLISSSNTLIIQRPFRAANTVSQLLSTGPTPNDSPQVSVLSPCPLWKWHTLYLSKPWVRDRYMIIKVEIKRDKMSGSDSNLGSEEPIWLWKNCAGHLTQQVFKLSKFRL